MRRNPEVPKNLKPIPFVCLWLATGLFLAFASGCATSQADREAQARIPKADAEKIALAKVPGGAIKEYELEREKGKLVWSFDIATPGTPDITEVLVDAATGNIVAIEKETPADQEKERQEKVKEKR